MKEEDSNKSPRRCVKHPDKGDHLNSKLKRTMNFDFYRAEKLGDNQIIPLDFFNQTNQEANNNYASNRRK